MDLKTQLRCEEGVSHSAYLDTLGVPTIGIGHTGPEVHLGLVWSDAQIAAAFDHDVAQKTAEVQACIPWFSHPELARGSACFSRWRIRWGRGA
jgi:lysozyme